MQSLKIILIALSRLPSSIAFQSLIIINTYIHAYIHICKYIRTYVRIYLCVCARARVMYTRGVYRICITYTQNIFYPTYIYIYIHILLFSVQSKRASESTSPP